MTKLLKITLLLTLAVSATACTSAPATRQFSAVEQAYQTPGLLKTGPYRYSIFNPSNF